MQGKKIIMFAAAFLIALGSWTTIHDSASASSSLEQELQDLERERERIEERSNERKQELGGVEEDLDAINEEIAELDQEIGETTSEIASREAEIEEIEAEIEALKEEIKEIEARIAERDELIKDRAASMYKSGGSSVEYLEVILGAESFGDFIERVHTLSTIAEQDRAILEEHQADHELLEEKKAKVEENLAALETHLQELEELRKELEGSMAVKESVMSDLKEEELELLDEINGFTNEKLLLDDQVASKQAEITKAEEEARVAAANAQAEREAVEAAEAAESEAVASASTSPSSSSESSSNSSNNNSSNASNPPSVGDTGGTLATPATGRISSQYGPRWGSFHHGIDIGAGGRSNVPIVAAESGTVSYAGWMNGYGNTVIVRHTIGGRTVETLYAHLDSIDVSNGQSVSRTQQIGIMGNTGASQGAHLHFEVHEGTWNGSKSNSVNPMNYL
ncbi:murein hydrolase activator EnvC family protein [Geomicrobium sediminis]|uniref:Murein DD-endopeptidase MepM/ murein hydrolase activator NlpD n=1 Tax=Geomicrobium sediminis TaxID=1347788 RepID=A0ABS2P7H9_9BACL|nr:M23 family metallopeptidase [Geomicrobium sediminis]MBM7631259.1 murein DD-endopeptidase MepM/ murein hydrolase activator NlpD [Geomicrobium sediminis]